MMNASRKIGVVSCSGESCVEGTLSRIATRFVLEQLQPENTVTICLPLFLTGEKGERMFTKYHPTIAVDGCPKQCAKNAIEKFSGPTANAVIVTELLKKWGVTTTKSRRTLDEQGLQTASRIADHLANLIETLISHSAR